MSTDWDRALALEQQDEIERAVEILRTQTGDAAPYWQSQASYLFQLRAERLWNAGRRDEARAAAKESIAWARQYASGATSGGEGAALSYQADCIERQLAKYL